jgi:hypothetical protein
VWQLIASAATSAGPSRAEFSDRDAANVPYRPNTPGWPAAEQWPFQAGCFDRFVRTIAIKFVFLLTY